MLSSARRQLGIPRRALSTTLSPMLYPLFRPLLFALDPETAHDVAFAGLDAAAALRRRAAGRAARRGVTGQGDGPRVSQSRRPRRGPRQECRAHRRPGDARLRLHRMRHGDAAAAAGQSEAAPVPPARGRSADQPARIQQRRRRSLSRQRRALALRCQARRHSRPQHRQATSTRRTSAPSTTT